MLLHRLELKIPHAYEEISSPCRNLKLYYVLAASLIQAAIPSYVKAISAYSK